MRQDENEGNKEGAKRGSHHLCSSLSPLCKVERGEMEMERGVSQVGPSPLPLLISPLTTARRGEGEGNIGERAKGRQAELDIHLFSSRNPIDGEGSELHKQEVGRSQAGLSLSHR